MLRQAVALLLASMAPIATADGGASALVGQASYHWAFMKLYDAELHAQNGAFDWDAPFDLQLTYATSFKAATLSNASVQEMSRLSGSDAERFEPLRPALEACFGDIERGDTVTGRSLSPDTAEFYVNGSLSCRIDWQGFRDAFFGIWLSDRARFQKQARRLLGDIPS